MADAGLRLRPQTDGDLPHPLGSYIYAGTLGMFLWDFIVHLQDEYRLFLKQKITLPTLVYFSCRLSVLCSVVAGTVFFTAPLDGWCPIMAKVLLSGLTSITMSSSLLLVLFIRALYTDGRFATVFSVISFFVVVGSSAIPLYSGVGRKANSTSPYCTIANKHKRLSQITTATMVMHRLIVFWAIGKKLLPPNDEEEPQTRAMKIRRTLEGRHLPEFSRTLWRHGQKNSLAFILAGLVLLTVFSSNILPEVYGFILGGVLTTVHNCLTSRLIRRVKAVSLDPERNMDITLMSGFLTNSGMR